MQFYKFCYKFLFFLQLVKAQYELEIRVSRSNSKSLFLVCSLHCDAYGTFLSTVALITQTKPGTIN